MAVYYFHLQDGPDELRHEEGVELPTVASMEAQALDAARSILSTEAREGRLPLNLGLSVEDARGAVVHRLSFGDAISITPRAA